jgi:hypothetical protein
VAIIGGMPASPRIFGIVVTLALGAALSSCDKSCHCDFGGFCSESMGACEGSNDAVVCRASPGGPEIQTDGVCARDKALGECVCADETKVYYWTAFTMDAARADCRAPCTFQATKIK